MDRRRLLNNPGLAEKWGVAQENEQIQKKVDRDKKEYDEGVRLLKERIKNLEDSIKLKRDK